MTGTKNPFLIFIQLNPTTSLLIGRGRPWHFWPGPSRALKTSGCPCVNNTRAACSFQRLKRFQAKNATGQTEDYQAGFGKPDLDLKTFKNNSVHTRTTARQVRMRVYCSPYIATSGDMREVGASLCDEGGGEKADILSTKIMPTAICYLPIHVP